MNKVKNSKGFTLAELLMALAILVTLMGIGFVAVNAYVKSLRRNEMTWTAKEIYLASQNQLSKAKAEGRLNSDEVKAIPEDYYYIVNGENVSSEVLEGVLLPFGAIDETVRSGGHYVIRFNLKSATVTHVYFSSEKNCIFSEGDLSNETFESAETTDDLKEYRIASDSKNYIMGMYKGDAVKVSVEEAVLPILVVKNEERLIAYVKAAEKSFKDMKVLLCLKGQTSGKKATVAINSEKIIIQYVIDGITADFDLDDINYGANQHFSEQFPQFIPGEDIEVFVTVQHKTKLSEILESEHLIRNSLFASKEEKTGGATVQIGYFRHLENLDPTISKLDNQTDKLNIIAASQIRDLDWNPNPFDPNEIRTFSERTGSFGNGFVPVNIDSNITSYLGNNRYISNVTIDASQGAAGLFGYVDAANFTVKDLELRNFNVKGAGSTGALIGEATALGTIDKVIAYNSQTDDSNLQIESSGGNAGGLIGTITGGTGSEVKNSVASVYVKAAQTAGGLVGEIKNSVPVSNSYSGGHTDGGYKETTDAGQRGRYNVIGNEAGGLIGKTAGTISNSYSTCSVKGTKGNALALNTAGNALTGTECYGAGTVNGTSGTGTPAAATDALPYDPKLPAQYPFKTISTDSNAAWFLSKHVGDWASEECPDCVNFINVPDNGGHNMWGYIENINVVEHSTRYVLEEFTGKAAYEWSVAGEGKDINDRWKCYSPSLIYLDGYGFYCSKDSGIDATFNELVSQMAPSGQRVIPLYEDTPENRNNKKLLVYTPESLAAAVDRQGTNWEAAINPPAVDQQTIFLIDRVNKAIWLRYQNGSPETLPVLPNGYVYDGNKVFSETNKPTLYQSGVWMLVTDMFEHPFG